MGGRSFMSSSSSAGDASNRAAGDASNRGKGGLREMGGRSFMSSSSSAGDASNRAGGDALGSWCSELEVERICNEVVMRCYVSNVMNEFVKNL
ncbi:hypothetical protein OROGR_005692 [Orobanche gracilis]